MIAIAACRRLRGLRLGFESHPAASRDFILPSLWERFSYYGMRALLTLFMVAPVAAGGLGFATPPPAASTAPTRWPCTCSPCRAGSSPIAFSAPRRSVLIGGTAIAAGHYALAVPSLATFYVGLTLIAFGTGLFKPNISALVGALYGS